MQDYEKLEQLAKDSSEKSLPLFCPETAQIFTEICTESRTRRVDSYREKKYHIQDNELLFYRAEG